MAEKVKPPGPPLLPPKPGRLWGYARVSTHDQNLDMQLNALKQAGCFFVFQDKGVSGAHASRPGLQEALEVIQPGEVLTVYKLDRLGRSVLNLSDLLCRLDQTGVHFRSLTEGIDTTTPGGKLVFHLFSAVAEFERSQIIERTKTGLAAARARGVQLGRPKLLSTEQVIEASTLITKNGMTIASVAQRFEVSVSTLIRALKSVEVL
jgi:DNA invertase Pin-like site-specific DNA recombinase